MIGVGKTSGDEHVQASVSENEKLHKRLELYYNVVEFDDKKYFLPNNPPEIYVVHL